MTNNFALIKPIMAGLSAVLLASSTELDKPGVHTVEIYKGGSDATPSSCIFYGQGTPDQTNTSVKTTTVLTIDASRQLANRAIDIIAALPENWNDNGAPSIPPDLIERTRDVLAKLPHMPAVSPTAMPGIQLDYEDSQSGYIEFELLDNGRVEMYFENALQTRDFEDELTDAAIPEMVQKFYDHTL